MSNRIKPIKTGFPTEEDAGNLKPYHGETRETPMVQRSIDVSILRVQIPV